MDQKMHTPYYMFTTVGLVLLRWLHIAVIVGLRVGFRETTGVVVCAWVYGGALSMMLGIGKEATLQSLDHRDYNMVFGLSAHFSLMIVEAIVFLGLSWIVQREFRFEFMKYYVRRFDLIALRATDMHTHTHTHTHTYIALIPTDVPLSRWGVPQSHVHRGVRSSQATSNAWSSQHACLPSTFSCQSAFAHPLHPAQILIVHTNTTPAHTHTHTRRAHDRPLRTKT